MLRQPDKEADLSARAEIRSQEEHHIGNVV
jgi:hypothetical protein